MASALVLAVGMAVFVFAANLAFQVFEPRMSSRHLAKAVLDQQLPGISSHPMIAMARGMSLNLILSMPQAAQVGFTREKAEAFLVEVNKQTRTAA